MPWQITSARTDAISISKTAALGCAGVESLGAQGYTLMQLMQIVGERNVRIVPDVNVSGATANPGMIDGMLGLMLRNQTNGQQRQLMWAAFSISRVSCKQSTLTRRNRNSGARCPPIAYPRTQFQRRLGTQKGKNPSHTKSAAWGVCVWIVE